MADSEAEAEAGPPVLITVHGTFGAAEEDEGDRWWQRGSRFTESLRAEVASAPDLVVHPFHWSGENSETSRREAAWELLDLFDRFEAEGRPYHVVAHSHGGNVVRGALLIRWSSTMGRRGATFEWLRSVTTLGTPYVTLDVPASARLLSRFAGTATVLAIILCVVSFSRSFNLTVAYTHLDDPEPWRALAVLAPVLAGVAILLLSGFVHAAVELRREAAALRRGVESLGARWLPLWSGDDEAIGGLRAALTADLPILRRTVTERGRASAAYSSGLQVHILFSHFIRELMKPVRRRLAPLGDRWIGAALRRAAGGADVGYTRVAAVGTSPFPGREAEPLPAEVDRDLCDVAERHLRDAAGLVRPMLRQTLTAAGVAAEETSAAFASMGPILVHNAYFESAQMVRRVARQIDAAGHAPPETEGLEPAPLGLTEYVDIALTFAGFALLFWLVFTDLVPASWLLLKAPFVR